MIIKGYVRIIGASEAKPLSSGWCETGSHGTSKPDGTTVRRGGAYHLHVTGQPRFTAILADTAELSHCQERPGLVNLPIGLQGQHC